MKRIFYFLFGVVLMLFLLYYISTLIVNDMVQGYVNQLHNYQEFWITHYIILGILLLISIIFIAVAFRPSKTRKDLIISTGTGDLKVTKKAINSYITKTISQFDNVRLNDLQTNLKSNKNNTTIIAEIDVLWVPDNEQDEPSIDNINEIVKVKLEEFTNASVDRVNINVVSQKSSNVRVI